MQRQKHALERTLRYQASFEHMKFSFSAISPSRDATSKAYLDFINSIKDYTPMVRLCSNPVLVPSRDRTFLVRLQLDLRNTCHVSAIHGVVATHDAGRSLHTECKPSNPNILELVKAQRIGEGTTSVVVGR